MDAESVFLRGVRTKWFSSSSLTDRFGQRVYLNSRPPDGADVSMPYVIIGVDSRLLLYTTHKEYWSHTLTIEIRNRTESLAAADAAAVLDVFNSGDLFSLSHEHEVYKCRLVDQSRQMEDRLVCAIDMIYSYQTHKPKAQ